MYSKSKKKRKRNTPIYFNTNYRTEMKLVPIIMDYCLLQFDVLKFFSGVHLQGGSLSNFQFFNVNPNVFCMAHLATNERFLYQSNLTF